MAIFIINATYRVITDLDDALENMKAVEAQRWEMLKKYGMEVLDLEVEKLS